jgi:hypothetical protein
MSDSPSEFCRGPFSLGKKPSILGMAYKAFDDLALSNLIKEFSL